ncbi:hypothetical protein MTR_4g045750 [Medicago truncatula]|uniref:Myb/SANT-like domain-containing protein n=1 Tax=Medicago truncatula TaxID=3880 RepID=A0A072UIR7_MEDTR|nr:hypothetical protein MTR_4g045750 [Medicago truncatula]
MDSLKRKVYANPPSTNNEGQSSKAIWRDLKATEYFINACLDQVTKGQRVGTCFTKKEWQDQLTTLVKDVVANGEHAWAPSSGALPNENLGGRYNNDVGLDVESSGDSEDASIGAITGFGNINLNTSQGSPNQSSGQKRVVGTD